MTTGLNTWNEIESQPDIWEKVLLAFTKKKDDLQEVLEHRKIDQAVVIGCGSTFYLSQSVAACFSRLIQIPARALPSSDVLIFPELIQPARTLLIAISRSGTTTETVRAVKKFKELQGGCVIAITCYPDSPLAKSSDFFLEASVAQETSIAQTRSFTSMLLLAHAFLMTLSHQETGIGKIRKLPNLLNDLILRSGDLPKKIGEDLDIKHIIFLGGGPLYGLANEGMLKMKEMSLTYSEAFHPLEFRHGPMSMASKEMRVIGLLTSKGHQYESEVLKDMQKLGARVMVASENLNDLTGWKPDYFFEIQSGLNEWIRGPLYIPILQRIAFYRAIKKGLDPDKPRNLTAVVKL